MLRFLTAGESHGASLIGILDGLPAGLKINKQLIDQDLASRQKGYGRGARMKIEKDKINILSGLRKGKTIGSPLALLIKNRDFKINVLPAIICPRPGHADLSGALKLNTKDMRDVLERASARETAMRVAIGAICRIFLGEFNIASLNHVISIGKVCAHTEGMSFNQIDRAAERSPLSCADKKAQAKMMAEIDKAKTEGDSLGGTFEIIVKNIPSGLGSYAQWDRRLDAKLAAALMSIPAIKGVEIGAGFSGACQRGSEIHDSIFYSREKGFFRNSNNAGGLEGGMTNGEPLVLRCAMKPIATLRQPLPSINIKSKRKTKASVERADVCAVPAAGVVARAMACFCIAQALIEKFAGDSLQELKRNYQGYLRQIRAF
ncbi:MAG: chorismate synthase [Candidatus Omnitrophica bacterium]|nr:chorismate synthase [Candidatus Omnitrophota bacterium]